MKGAGETPRGERRKRPGRQTDRRPKDERNWKEKKVRENRQAGRKQEDGGTEKTDRIREQNKREEARRRGE